MASLALALSLLIAGLGLIGIVQPTALFAFGRQFAGPGGLYTAAALRLLFGTALWLAAPGSHAPRALRIVGVLVVVAALVTPFIGPERFAAMLDVFAAQGPLLGRFWGLVALGVGLLLAYLLRRRPGGARPRLPVSR
jgi:hypothetical protein